MRRLLCAFLAFAFCTAALSAECPIGTTPAQYMQLEYLESTGIQWIDTGYYANNDSEIICTSQMSRVSGHTPILGYRQNNEVRSFIIGVSTKGEFYAQFDSSVRQGSLFESDLEKHTFGLSANGFVQDNEVVATFTNVSFFYTDSIMLFGAKIESGIVKSSVKIYNVKIKQNDVLVRDFVPAMRLSDGKPGMYDKVSGQFFTNAGTGEFIAGPEVPTEFMNFNECSPCPPNTYKDFVGNGECTPCPDALISPSGSKSVSECGRVLHVGDKIYHMKSVKQTSPSLHIRDENGNVWYGNLYSEQE